MAIFKGTIRSEALKMKTQLTVVIPDTLQTTDRYPVVYLLHGLSGNVDDWSDGSQVWLLAKAYNVIFVIPEVQRSFYTDMAFGPAYDTYISQELPTLCQKLFPISPKREDTYIMGLSMGGYGALKCAFKKPEQYAGCAAFSPAWVLQDLEKYLGDQMDYQELQAIWGMDLEKMEENDLRVLAKQCEKSPVKPDVFVTCGTEDYIYHMSVQLRDFMKDIDLPFTYQEWPGSHEFYLWNKSLHLACEHFLTRVDPENYCNIV